MTEEVEEKVQTSILIRLDEQTRKRLDSAISRLPDPKGMQAAIARASLKLYLTLSERDFKSAEMQIKRIVQDPELSLNITRGGQSV
mgnify:CR=1 FL=1